MGAALSLETALVIGCGAALEWVGGFFHADSLECMRFRVARYRS